MPATPKDCPGPEACAPVQQSAAGWHLKREIQLGHIITTISVAVSAAAFVVKMDQRLVVLETKHAALASAQADRDTRQDQQAHEALAMLRAQLARMDEKLDRLIEGRHK